MAATGLLAALLLGYAQPVKSQIAVIVDEHGKRVFVNADSPAARFLARSRKPARQLSGGQAAQRTLSPALARPDRLPDGQVGGPRKEDLERMAREIAERHRLDPALVLAMIQAESHWDPTAVSSKGAQGLMQLVPGTAEDLGVDDAFDPAKNIEGGVRYLETLLERYDGALDKALAAYNAGATAVDRVGGVPHYPETRAYVQKVIATYFQPGSGRGAPTWYSLHPIYRTVNPRGRIVFTNE
jgi:soluble lytic murein transglycosylase-like protein